MTTLVVSDDGPDQRPSSGRLGALAAATPIAMFVTWIVISGWGGTTNQFVLATVEIALGAVAAGWIVGGHLGRSVPARLIGVVAYGLVGSLVLLPLNVAGSTWEELQAGQVSDSVGLVVTAGRYVLYGAVSAIYTAVFLLPFGAGWMVTFLVLRRAFGR